MAGKKTFKECPFCEREVEEGLLQCPHCDRIYRLIPESRVNEERPLPPIKKGFRAFVITLLILSCIVCFYVARSYLTYFYKAKEREVLVKKGLMPRRTEDVLFSSQKTQRQEIVEEVRLGSEWAEKNAEKPSVPMDKLISSEGNKIPEDETKGTGEGKAEAFAHLRKGINFKRKGEWDLAEREFSESIKLDPTIAWAHYGLGRVYHQKGMDDEALREFEEALKFNPKIAWAHYQMGKIYQEREEFESAIREFQRAVKIDDRLLWVHYRLAEIYKKVGEREKAKKELEIYENLRKINEE